MAYKFVEFVDIKCLFSDNERIISHRQYNLFLYLEMAYYTFIPQIKDFTIM